MPPTPIELAQWVLRAQCGDRDALELVLRAVQPALRRYISGLVGADDADDILQDVLLIVSRKLYWLEQPTVFRAWAFRIASRAAFRYLRKRRRWQEATVVAPRWTTSPRPTSRRLTTPSSNCSTAQR